MTTCDDVRDLAPELALGTLDGTQRAMVMAHVVSCPGCRDEVGGLTDTVDLLSHAAPPMTPSAGFEQRVLAAMVVDAASETAPVVPIGRQPRRPTWLALVAAVIVAIAGSAVVTRSLTSDHLVSPVESATMVGSGGRDVGDVYLLHASPDVVVVSVRYSNKASTYDLQGIGVDGAVQTLGPLHWVAGQWRWNGTVDTSAGAVRSFRVVSSTGDIFCEGHLPA